jgi:transcription elongation factor SPT5
MAAPSRGGFGAGRGRGGRDPLISKTVAIVGGPYKGYIGIVKDVLASGARVELHTNSKIVTIDREKLQIQGATFSSRPRNDFGSSSGGYLGSRTPAWGDGSRTPAYGDGSRTPAYGDGSRTPAYGDGSRTPAWDASSRTPAHPSGSRTPAWDSGSRTPARDGAWDAGSKTPAHGGMDYDDDYNMPFKSALYVYLLKSVLVLKVL